jgi:TetR/AcrR family transcriptional regulator, transcriptional repressor of bet genes
MPKRGMGPVRREQICRAAAKVISEQGFAGTTMRMVADEAGVSTGMLNHYFANRMEMLEETLLFVSMRQQARESAAIEGLEAGEGRLRALVRSALPITQESMEAWRVWVAAHGASVRLPELSRVMASRNELWFKIIERGLEGVVPPVKREQVPYVWQFDALLNGLVIQAISTGVDVKLGDIEQVIVSSAVERGRARASREEVPRPVSLSAVPSAAM